MLLFWNGSHLYVFATIWHCLYSAPALNVRNWYSCSLQNMTFQLKWNPVWVNFTIHSERGTCSWMFGCYLHRSEIVSSYVIQETHCCQLCLGTKFHLLYNSYTDSLHAARPSEDNSKLSQSRNAPSFVEPEGRIPCSHRTCSNVSRNKQFFPWHRWRWVWVISM
jgi:hypothetical protein